MDSTSGFHDENKISLDTQRGTKLPVITLGELAKNATDGERALLDAGIGIYQQCGRLVRPIVETVAAAKGRRTSVARLVEVDQYYLRDLLSRHALWRRLGDICRRVFGHHLVLPGDVGPQRDLDPKHLERSAMLTAWAEAIGVGSDKRLTLVKVIEVAKVHKDLQEAIQLVPTKKQGVDPRSLGLWLRDNRGTVVGNRRFDNYTNSKGGSQWWIEEI